jgi:predicted GNAT superfamily acetyltransferase
MSFAMKSSGKPETGSMKDDCRIRYRPLTRLSEFAEVIELQELVWPTDMLTALPQLVAATLNGGSVIGAFADDRLLGFCYGFAGSCDGETYLASHMMAIHPKHRDRGIGMRLKLEQRLWAIQQGYRKIVWTFDPFEARNGYLNLCKLGGTVQEYIPALYGDDFQSLPTDRFKVSWDLHSDRVERALAGHWSDEEGNEWDRYPSLLTYVAGASRILSVQPNPRDEQPGYLLPIPGNIRQMKQENLPLAAQWQSCLRRLCPLLFSSGYQVVALKRRDGVHHDYVIEVAS